MEVMKRIQRLLILAAFLVFLFLPIYNAQGQDYIEYNIRINDDASAEWRIIQVSDINAPIDTWTEFQQRIPDLVEAAANATQREMGLDFDSMQIDTTSSSESKTTEYLFTWLNFSMNQGYLLSFGDVFRVDNFFAQLYGDSSLKITYSPNFVVKSIFPEPNERDNRTQMLVWYRTQDFLSGNPAIVLTSSNPAENGNDGNWLAYLAVGVVTASAIASITLFFVLKRRKSARKTVAATSPTVISLVESDEDRIINIIKSSGGTLRQSVVTEKSKFSKAKTSQLLAALEQKRVVTRVKKGRDKIVTLNNEK